MIEAINHKRCRHALEFVKYSIDSTIKRVNGSGSYTEEEKNILFKLQGEIKQKLIDHKLICKQMLTKSKKHV